MIRTTQTLTKTAPRCMGAVAGRSASRPVWQRTLVTSFASSSRVSQPHSTPASLSRLTRTTTLRPEQQQRLFSLSSARRQEEQKSEPTSGESEIISLLTKRFQPAHLQVQDVSGGCGSFYAIVVAAKDFQGLSTVKQHRLVNECLKDIIGGIHGLQLKTIPSD